MFAEGENKVKVGGLNGNIPPELGNCSELTYLFLQDNGLDGEIPTELRQCSNLEELHLDNNQLTGGEAGTRHADRLVYFKSLTPKKILNSVHFLCDSDPN